MTISRSPTGGVNYDICQLANRLVCRQIRHSLIVSQSLPEESRVLFMEMWHEQRNYMFPFDSQNDHTRGGTETPAAIR